MKYKQLAAFIGTYLCLAVLVVLTCAVVNKAISLGLFFILAFITGVVWQVTMNYLKKQFKNGEWV